MDDGSAFEKLRKISLNAPKTSGVYLWKDKNGEIIYVGKAKSLKNRLCSYFNSGKDIKTRILISRAYALEYIQTDNEYEALLLENTFIKEHKPKYNINLKDGKTYPVLKLTNEKFPRIYRTRNIRNDGARYFGPFSNVPSLDVFLDLIKRNYKIRQCRRLIKREQPCLYYHIGRCCAPCCKKISEEEYGKGIEEICRLLDGGDAAALFKLERKMKEAAAAKDFEQASRLRDGLQAIRSISGTNIVEDLDEQARDYIAWASIGEMITFTVLRMRNGRLITRDIYRAETLKDEEEAFLEFLMSYYTEAKQTPPRIFVLSCRNYELAEKWLAEETGVKTHIISAEIEDSGEGGRQTGNIRKFTAAEPDAVYLKNNADKDYFKNNVSLTRKEKKHHSAVLRMAHFNAKEETARCVRELGDYPAIDELQHILKLKHLPYRIEGFDIAHIQGRFTVAGMVSFKNGTPDKKNYRIFKLKNTEGIIDDYASMREAVARRYTRLINAGEDLPDLILIDGGLGQVNAAKNILQALELDIPLIGLAEKNEEIYFPNNSEPIVLPRRSYALRLLQRIRDEVHRFSNTRTNLLNIKEKTKLSFEKIPHVGKRKAAKLLKAFASIEKLKDIPAEEISTAIKVSIEQAEEIKKNAKLISEK